MHPSKIAIFTERMGDGPFPIVCAALVRGFKEAGADCEVVVLGVDQKARDTYPSVPMVNLQVDRAILSILPLTRYLRRVRPDVVYATHWYFNVIAIWAKLLARVPTKVIMGEANIISLEVRVEHRNNVRMRLVPWLMRWTYPHGDGAIGVAEDVVRDLRENIKVPARVPMIAISNPIDLEDVLKRSRQPATAAWMPEDGSPLVLTAARLAKQKELDVLLRAFALVLKEVPTARLAILGEGVLRDALEKLCRELGIEQSVAMPGYIKNAARFMAKCTVFVLASAFEGCPVALEEAMACGAAVVVNDAPGGSKDMVEGGKQGVVVRRGDVDALAQAIIELVIDPVHRSACQAQAALRARDFNYSIVAQRYLEFYRSLCGEPPAVEEPAISL